MKSDYTRIVKTTWVGGRVGDYEVETWKSKWSKRLHLAPFNTRRFKTISDAIEYAKQVEAFNGRSYKEEVLTEEQVAMEKLKE